MGGDVLYFDEIKQIELVGDTLISNGTNESKSEVENDSRRTRDLAVITILRDFGDEFTSASEELFNAYSNNRTELMRMQLLHISELSRQVNNLNEHLGYLAADLIVVTGGNLLRTEARFILRKGARIETVDGGYDMRALWSFGWYRNLLYIRPGNSAIDVDRLTALKTDAVDWINDQRMRPILALWSKPAAARFLHDYTAKDLGKQNLRFLPKSLNECTTRITSGYADATLRKCFLHNNLEETPAPSILAGTKDDALYTLPIEVAWKKAFALASAGLRASWLFGQLELLDAKACAKDLQVRQMSKVAGNQISEIVVGSMRRSGRFTNQHVVMKTHILSDRVNRTLHSWAKSLNKEGGELIAAVLGNGTHGRLFDQFKMEQKRGGAINYGLMHVNNEGVAKNVVPFEAVDAYNRTCSKSQYENGQKSGTNHSNVFLLKRMQSLYLHELMAQVEAYNAKAKSPVAQLIIVTSSGSLAELARRALGPSVQLEITDPGFEMRALWALKTFKRVLYLRPGNRLRSDWTLAEVENALRDRNCLLRAPFTVAAQEIETKDRNLKGQVSDTIAPSTSADLFLRRRLNVPSSKITEQNHAVDIEKFPKLSVPLIDFKNDASMRPVQALWISPNESLSRNDVSRYWDENLFRPETLSECTSGIVAGYGGKMHECQLAKIIEKVPDAQLLTGTTRQGRYPLPVDIAWKGESVMQSYGKLAGLLYGQSELEDVKLCAKAFQVEKYGKLAKEQIVSRLTRPPRREPRHGRNSRQAMVMKTHSVSTRINQTLHAWARDLYQSGGEVVAAFLSKNDSKDDYHLLETEHKRGTEIGFEVIRLDSESIVNTLIPYEAQAAFAKGCETLFFGLLCQKVSPDDKIVFHEANQNVDRLMWLHTTASSMVIFKHMLDTRPDLEYLPRATSWDHAVKKKARENVRFHFDILTRTSFRFEEDNKVHIPDEDDDENAQEGDEPISGADNATADVEEALQSTMPAELRHEGAISPQSPQSALPSASFERDRHHHGEEASNKSPVTTKQGLPARERWLPRIPSTSEEDGEIPGNGTPFVTSGRASPPLSEMHPLLAKQVSEDSIGSYAYSGAGSPRFRNSTRFSFRKFWLYCGPGWLMSVAYLDPGNIESDLQAGAFHGYQLLWVLTVATLLGLFYQCLAVRLGVVMNKNLAEACREHYGRWDTYVLFAMMQLAVIGSDCQELLGSAIAFRVLFGIPLWVGCLLTGLDTLTFLGLHVIGVRQLELFFVVLIGLMVLCFVGTFLSDPGDPVEIAHGLFVPYVQKEASVQAVSILGAVVMPHNIFLHSALVLSRDIDRSRPHRVAEANYYFSIEAGLALLVSLLINVAVVAVFAHGFYSDTCSAVQHELRLEPGNVAVQPPYACVPLAPASHGAHSSISCVTDGGVQGSCMPIGLQGAASALGAFVGEAAAVVWSIGLLAAGQSSTMTGTYAGQFIMEGFLELEIPNWVRVGITRAVSLIPALVVAVLANSNLLAADKLDEMLNVLQSLQLPFALFPLLLFTGSSKYMGPYANSKTVQTMGLAICIVVICINAYLVVNTVDLLTLSSVGLTATLIFLVIYVGFVSRLGLGMWRATKGPTTTLDINGRGHPVLSGSSHAQTNGYGASAKHALPESREYSHSIPSLD
ncbi:Natural resistance-associated macrophage protein 1 [Hondaea fermentalgiana]|uniref:Natural resistance-associated macrophage protein 1 n=1 Tax=Hondaea fermentalgiana TaxID=2315210 RepID=A0A2R5GK67_9STRA|nr:Natural resistance-associated macrophage protein 1 [Hondaea fermentalgiana]|eukprot:GBG30118.1 Natural resistance-associated macrophage protein 1 [Hondaea fermentalgiana]